MEAKEYFYKHWQEANREKFGEYGEYNSDEYAIAFANDYAALCTHDVLEQKEDSRRINELLAKFDNGVELYQNNAIFANYIEHLLRGGDVYKILEQIIVMYYRLQERYKNLVEGGTLRQELLVTKERFDEIKEGHI